MTVWKAGALWCLLAASGAAHAATGLVWQWPEDEARRFRLKADISLHQAVMLEAEYNRSARVYDLAIALDVKCTPTRLGKSSIEVACDVDAAQLQAGGEDDDNLPMILQEWDDKLENDARIQMSFTNDGKVREIDLVGLNERNQRIRLIKETLHAFVTRMFSTFDLQLPKEGDDEGKSWRQRSEMVVQLPMITGSAGSSQLNSTVSSVDGDHAIIDTVGRSTLMIGQQVSGPGNSRPPDVFDLTLSSRAVFDTAQGILVGRTLQVRGDLTPSSGSAMGTKPAPYLFAAEVQYVPPGAAMPMLGDSTVRPMR